MLRYLGCYRTRKSIGTIWGVGVMWKNRGSVVELEIINNLLLTQLTEFRIQDSYFFNTNALFVKKQRSHMSPTFPSCIL